MSHFFTSDVLTSYFGGVLINQRHDRSCLPVMILHMKDILEGPELLLRFFNHVIYGPLFLKMLMILLKVMTNGKEWGISS